jgi:murein DD-endopeptidase MepM/ murein hydrolase activator NlpD
VADAALINYIRRAQKEHGLSQRQATLLMAGALQESGGKSGAVGDGGTSFGYYQFHKGGALPRQYFGNPFPYADSYEVVSNRAREIKRLNATAGKGFAMIQRPADPTGYARGVDSLMQRAAALLGGAAPKPTTGTAGTGTPAAVAPPTTNVADPAAALKRQAALQSIIDQNSKLAGISSITVPLPSMPTPTPELAPAQPQKQKTPKGQAKTTAAGFAFPTGAKPQLIGTPGQGTHTRGNWQSDNAVDLRVPVGTPIYATTDGVIGPSFGNQGNSGPTAGRKLTLVGKGNSWWYGHLSKYAPGIKPGARVRKGQIIGYSGSANGVPHLHLGVQSGDPRTLLGL